MDDEERELSERYPEGSLERQVLDYSRSESIEEEVPPMLLGTFTVLMGISFLSGIVALLVYFNS